MQSHAQAEAGSALIGHYDERLCAASRALEQAAWTNDPHTIPPVLAALAQFFTPEIESAVFEPTKPETHRQCKFVYMVSAECVCAVKGHEARIASILAQFCLESDGAMELYHCKTKYHSVGYSNQVLGWGEERVFLRQELVLLSPWQSLGARSASASIHVSGVEDWQSVNADVEEEVAPSGIFERPKLEFDAQTGFSTREKWHTGGAFVLLPIGLRAQLEFAGDISAMLENWLVLVGWQPPLAVAAMEAIGKRPRVWPLDSPLGVRVLHGIQKLQSVSALTGLLKSCRFIAFQPALHSAVSVFTTEELVAMLQSLTKGVYRPNSAVLSNRLNAVASMLHDEADATRISLLLDAQKLYPSWWCANEYPPGAVDHTTEEFARVLQIALRVSVDCTKTLATSSDGTTAVKIAQAVRVLVDWRGGSEACGDDVLAVVRHAHTQLASLLPEIRNAPYNNFLASGCHAYRTCGSCEDLRVFVASTEETAEFDKLSCEAHFLERFQRTHYADKFTIEDANDATGAPRIRITKSYEDEAFNEARANVSALKGLLKA